ncbi:MAG: GNAT family N-acetyltransferase [Gemmatimonadetes bacterium]|uniref:GNAT family N-acetyltransferase n=1 Tax=Candidatus Kutchimonas denitrificans TaxID=3056748 RepID=A0AAE5C9Q2_9BACT|nr:GNAT family N-acetyltransferase [Gemmatimonadota bacterium]NIR73667.1 GNAT family N-acetyltransferase [Candidatus Kutchimonas denitrificans]NIS00717.1 GNAT family N-acetyltransferase [Gemmatimonadota bacterium]NIT66304.1 GNAT family N-acetyltransferase [Gemmatimonadota bacterium]NIU51522.1 GNAT family N-acetyltransferase [Gemmatimonadota bacterium]
MSPASRSERSTIEGMLDPYLRELSTYREVRVGPVDAAAYAYLEDYWTDPNRFPFLIWQGDLIVGFALLRRFASEDPPRMQMAEFYIAPCHRREGIGQAAAAAFFERFPGPWELETQIRNEAAIDFWTRCIKRTADDSSSIEEFEASDGRRLRFRFHVGPAA